MYLFIHLSISLSISPFPFPSGTIEERGLTHWQYYQQAHSSASEPNDVCYDLPFGMNYLKK